MRIDDFNRTSLTQGAEQSGQTNQARTVGNEPLGKNVPDSTSVAGTDQAEVSPLAQSLAASGSERLEQLQLEVQSGKYDVPAEAVANALIEAHLKG